MITVGFPNGQAIRYNNADDVIRENGAFLVMHGKLRKRGKK